MIKKHSSVIILTHIFFLSEEESPAGQRSKQTRSNLFPTIISESILVPAQPINAWLNLTCNQTRAESCCWAALVKALGVSVQYTTNGGNQYVIEMFHFYHVVAFGSLPQQQYEKFLLPWASSNLKSYDPRRLYCVSSV